MRSGLLVMGLLVAASACATAGTTRGAEDRSVITQDQVEDYNGESVYLLVQSLRPSWLQTRGRVSMMGTSPVVVYINGIRAGGVGELRNLHPREVVRLEHLDARQATGRYGTGHASGAILVTLK